MIRAALIAIGSVIAAGAAVFVVGEFYNLTAVRQHPAWLYHAIVTARDTIIKLDARSVEVPDGYAPAATAEGIALYQHHCVQCHGAPGVAPDDLALGMMPVPTNLVHSARRRPPEHLFWYVHNGLKMSGMPSWSGRMSEADMWRVIAFVEALPTLAPAEYEDLLDQAGGGRDAVDPLPQDRVPANVAEADPERGRTAMQLHACHACHEIPGLVGATVRVGPPLDQAGARRYIAGVLPNTPENMVRWLMDPKDVDPLTAMPDLRLTLGEARDMAAYLYSTAPEPDVIAGGSNGPGPTGAPGLSDRQN